MEFYKSRIEQLCAQFYMQYLSDSPPDKILYTANTYLPRMRSQLPPPQGEQEAAVLANRDATKKQLFMAQISDFVAHYQYWDIYLLFIGEAPEYLRNSFQEVRANFIETTTEEMLAQVQRSLVQGDRAWMMSAALGNLFEKNVSRYISRLTTIRDKVKCYWDLKKWSAQGHKLFRFNVVVQEGNCSTCFGHYNKTYTREQILSQELLPPLHPNCKCSLEPADEGTPLPEEKPNTFQYNITHWDNEIKQLWDSFNQVQDERKSNIHDFWSWLDYWSAGKMTRLKELKAKADSSYYIMDKIDLYTLGLIDDWARMIIGTFWPEKPGSVEHTIDSIGTAAMAIGAAKGLQSFATGGSAAGGTSGAARLLDEGLDATDDVIRKEVLYALDDVGDEIQRGAINAVDDVGDAARREIIEIPLGDQSITGSGIADDVAKGGSGATNKGAKGLIGHDFEKYLDDMLGGEGSRQVGGRDFDGVKGNRWWEAKSGRYWELLESDPKKLSKFKSDMGDRLNIAKQNGATYELFSNTPIPQAIKDWLIKKGIPFTEILD